MTHPEKSDDAHRSAFRALPSVAALASDPEVMDASSLSPASLTTMIRAVLDDHRTAIVAGARPDAGAIRAAVLAALRATESVRLRPVINATGVIVHTNLGRAPVSEETAAAMAAAAGASVPLETEPESNRRGGRMDEISGLMRLLVGAEATLVVNNNAAAVLLTLAAVAEGRGVVLSRGEAVEIGGGFRVPDVMRQSGARLVEVGTTNRTYAADYERAVAPDTAALLKIHPSNFKVTGFVHDTGLAELADVAQRAHLPLLFDQGSGTVLDPRDYGLGGETTLGQSVRDGATITMASGDKLLGGPQAGLILGDRTWVETIARHPLARAVRADKTCLAGVAATLRHYVRGEAERRLPVWRMITLSFNDLRARADRIIMGVPGEVWTAATVSTKATVGGGSLPGETLDSVGISLSRADSGAALDDLARRLRLSRPGVFGRIEDGRLVLDLRTVLPEDDERLERVLAETLATAPA